MYTRQRIPAFSTKLKTFLIIKSPNVPLLGHANKKHVFLLHAFSYADIIKLAEGNIYGARASIIYKVIWERGAFMNAVVLNFGQKNLIKWSPMGYR